MGRPEKRLTVHAWSQPRCPKALAMVGFLSGNLPRSKEKATDQRGAAGPSPGRLGLALLPFAKGCTVLVGGLSCAPLVSSIPGFYPPRPAAPPPPPCCDDQNCLQTLPNVHCREPLSPTLSPSAPPRGWLCPQM